MIEELVRKGYDSDPVKAWKLKQDREAILVSFKILYLLLYNGLLLVCMFCFSFTIEFICDF